MSEASATSGEEHRPSSQDVEQNLAGKLDIKIETTVHPGGEELPGEAVPMDIEEPLADKGTTEGAGLADVHTMMETVVPPGETTALGDEDSLEGTVTMEAAAAQDGLTEGKHEDALAGQSEMKDADSLGDTTTPMEGVLSQDSPIQAQDEQSLGDSTAVESGQTEIENGGTPDLKTPVEAEEVADENNTVTVCSEPPVGGEVVVSADADEVQDMGDGTIQVVLLAAGDSKSAVDVLRRVNAPLSTDGVASCIVCCGVCGLSCDCSATLRQHLAQAHGMGHVCTTCDTSFQDEAELEAHRKTHTVSRRSTCDICQRTFANKSVLRQHKFSHPEFRKVATGAHRCEDCKETFSGRQQLNAHLIAHHGKATDFHCAKCDKYFTDRQQLATHNRRHAATVKATVAKSLTCEECGKAFTSQSHLKRHAWTHSAERKFKCDQCSATFNQKIRLFEHQRRHSGDKPFSCETCNRKFVTQSNLARHRLVHSNERKFQCDTCNNTF